MPALELLSTDAPAQEAAIVDYLAAHQLRSARAGDLLPPLRPPAQLLPLAQPPQRTGDPCLDPEPPPRRQQEADWLTEEELARLLSAAEHPPGGAPGSPSATAVVFTLVQTGLRRLELIALDDLELGLFELQRPRCWPRCCGAKGRRRIESDRRAARAGGSRETAERLPDRNP